MTLGSPLGDETVKDRLRGRGATNERRYPANIRRWVNIYAEDDFISHDGRLRNDYKKMWRAGLVELI